MASPENFVHLFYLFVYSPHSPEYRQVTLKCSYCPKVFGLEVNRIRHEVSEHAVHEADDSDERYIKLAKSISISSLIIIIISLQLQVPHVPKNVSKQLKSGQTH